MSNAVSPIAPSFVRVAGVILKWIRGDKAANFRRVEPLIRAAAANGAQIVCTTECFLDGYAVRDKEMPIDDFRALGELVPGGELYARLAGLAAELRIFLVAGMLEADGTERFNTAAVIGPDGALVGKYRKRQLNHEADRNAPGTESPGFRTPFGTLGVMICSDRLEPPIAADLRTSGADLVLCLSGGMFGPARNDPILQARSRENGFPIVFVHPAEFLVTDALGNIAVAELFGDVLLIDATAEGSGADTGGVRYVDLPTATAR